jgi:hypothetical protein
VDFTDTFRLFATTRLPNPHFTPELCAKVTVVDFTVTTAGGRWALGGRQGFRAATQQSEACQGLQTALRRAAIGPPMQLQQCVTSPGLERSHTNPRSWQFLPEPRNLAAPQASRTSCLAS